jgi:hypothetical protein
MYSHERPFRGPHPGSDGSYTTYTRDVEIVRKELPSAEEIEGFGGGPREEPFLIGAAPSYRVTFPAFPFRPIHAS